MLRTFNYTGRHRIEHQQVHIRLEVRENKAPTFSARLDLPDSIPGHCRVFIEAYRKQTSQRFDFGTVSRLKAPTSTEISEVDLAGKLLFRVRVIDDSTGAGSVVASGERIAPQDALGNTNSMMPILAADLGEVPWKLDIDGTDDYPTLCVNRAIPDAKSRFEADPVLISLVLPAALREVLVSYVFLTPDDEKEGSARLNWLDFAEFLVPPPDDDADRETQSQWIDEVIAKFCDQHNLASMLFDEPEEDSQ